MKYQSIVQVSLSLSRRVTVWRSEPTLKRRYDNADLMGCAIMNSQVPASQLADQLIKMERVSVVEVIDGDGHGIRFEK